MPVYAIVVGPTGHKLTKNDTNPNGLPGLIFRGLGVRVPPPTNDLQRAPGALYSISRTARLEAGSVTGASRRAGD
jgi:hypothetical protein